jgi:hypothetical protein
VAAVDVSDHTPYFPDEIRDLALIDDRYVSKLVFDVHNFTNFQNKLVHFAVAWPFSYTIAGSTN